jgi:hypothetical protein
VIKVFGEDVQFDGSYVNTEYTIRELTDIYLQYQPWGDLGIDICLGLPMDKKATPNMYMYLPDYIESGFDNATIIRNGELLPLVKNKRVVYNSRGIIPIENSILTPLNVFSALLILILIVSVIGFLKGNHKYWIDGILFTAIGFLGVFLFLLWVATDHNAAGCNMNLIWAIPTHLMAGMMLWRKKKPNWLNRYFLSTTVIGALNLLLWPVLPQMLHYSLIPIVILLTLRSIKIWNSLR